MGMIKNSAEALLSIINDILDFSKVEAGKLRLEPTPFALREFLHDALQPLAFRAHTKKIELVWQAPCHLPDALIGDFGRLRQVLVNLVGNAIKFTDRGEVVISVESDTSISSDESNVGLHFAVSDTGVGIEPSRCQAIFEPFEQADGSTTRKYGGTGLGLTICARLVELMQGHIWVESTPGCGATFHFTCLLELDRSPQAVSDTRRSRCASPPPMRVLLAEDNAVNQRVAVLLLEKHGHCVTVANDGREAIDALRCASFDLVLMDVQMPTIDGLDATRQVRQLEQSTGSARVPIIAMTAHAMSGDRQRCLAAGMDGYVAKPIRADELFEQMWSVMRPPANLDDRADAEAASTVSDEAASAEVEVDWNRALAAMGGDESILREVADAFVTEAPTMLRALCDSLEKRDAVRFRQAAHTLKGAIGYFSKDRAYPIALDLEALGCASKLDEAPPLVDSLLRETDLVCRAVGQRFTSAKAPR
jgi:CheY-like chemotaxis protein